MSPPVHALTSALAARFPVVPVTARDLDSFRRVDIAGVPLVHGAVLANGAVMIAPGASDPDPQHAAETDALLAPHAAAFDGVLRLLERAGDPVRPRLVAGAGEHPAYLVAKAPPGWWDSESGVRLVAEVKRHPFASAVLGTELQVLPAGISKRDGLLAFMRRWTDGTPPLLTMGDMPADAPFMKLGAFMAAPAGSPLSQLWPS